MVKLNFPSYTFRLQKADNKELIFDTIRKKFVVLTPEEWVRQHTICFLMEEHQIPRSHINVEKELRLNKLKKRYDIVVFDRNGGIYLIVECKAPSVPIQQATFDQIARYNMVLDAQYLMVTNGLDHYYCQLDKEKESYRFLRQLPLKSE
ncbi:MAG: type I restriction enzyme HsdR N-terminal domain-containing protein [Flavobacteriaceae bacterium]|nr:type I restriction enzyme HsdR N-terminal domain-containing protein [Flavobacteriaceae bacterium]